MSERSFDELLRINFNDITHSIEINQPIREPLYVTNLYDKMSLMNKLGYFYYSQNVLPLLLAISYLVHINIIKYLKNKWYEEFIKVDNPGCYANTHLYKDGYLNVKEGIRDIIQWKYYMILYNRVDRIRTDKQKEYFINLLDQYAELFNVTYKKDDWATVFG